MPDIFLRPGEASSSDVKLRDTTLADSGGAFTATGTWDQAAASWAAEAAETFSSTAAFTQVAASWSATAAQDFAATASFAQTAATWSAAATQTFAATGTWTQAAATWDAIAAETFAATGAWTQAAAAWSATASVPFTATGTWDQAPAAWAAESATTADAEPVIRRSGPPLGAAIVTGAKVRARPVQPELRVLAAAFAQPAASWAAQMTYRESIEWLVLDEYALIGA